MTGTEDLRAAAAANGWRVHAEPEPGCAGSIQFRRRNGRKTEYIRVELDAHGRVSNVTWSPGLDGIGARRPRRDRRAWTLDRLKEARR